MPVVFVGVAMLDVIALVDAFPPADGRVPAQEVVHAGGGPAATAAVTAARLGVDDVRFVGTVGDDEHGRRIVDQLVAESVDVSGVRVDAHPSGVSVAIVDRGQGTRALCARPGPPLDLTGTQQQFVRTADWVHVDHLGWAPVAGTLSAQASPPPLSVDEGNPIPDFTPRDVDLYVPTVEVLAHRYGELPVDELLTAARTEGARTIVATLGSSGSVAATASGERVTAPPLDVDPYSTLGAGDVFHGAVVTAALRDQPIDHCLAYANVVAGLSCRGLDGRSAIPTHEEACRVLRQHRS